MEKGGSGYFSNRPWIYTLLVIAAWGTVPVLAKSANFPGGFTTFWVNIFAAVGVLVVMTLTGQLYQFKAVHLYGRFLFLGAIWPMAYSIAYFTVISTSSASLATLMNYMWPLFALLMMSRSTKVPIQGLFLVGMGFAGIVLALVLEGNFEVILIPVIIGLVAPLTQAHFNVITSDESKYPAEYAWLLTFLGAVVTAIGGGIFIVIRENGQFLGPAATEYLPLAIIGLVGNTIGFYAFLRASQAAVTTHQKIMNIFLMFLIPFVQVAALMVSQEPDINPVRLVGIAGVAVGYLVFKLWMHRRPS